MNNRRDEQYGHQQFGRHNAELRDEEYGERDPRFGYGEGMRGGFSYANEPPRGGMSGPMNNVGPRRVDNENLANDFSVEGTRNFSRDERRGGTQQVSHRGKGPKGFKRTDDRIKELVSEALSDHHFIDASEIELTVKDGEVTLSGTVGDRGLKRLTEDIVEAVPGVLDVHNTLRIAGQTASTAVKPNMAPPRSQH